MFLKRKYLLFFILFLTSCSTPSVKKASFLTEKAFASNLKASCQESEGKGRVRVGEKSYSFSYSSGFQNKETWAMGVEIPLKGEEDLWAAKLEGDKYKLKGRFYRRIVGSFESYRKSHPEYKKKHLRKFLFFLSHVIFLQNEFLHLKKMAKGKKCKMAPDGVRMLWCGFEYKKVAVKVYASQLQFSMNTEGLNLFWENQLVEEDGEKKLLNSKILLKIREKKLMELKLFPARCQNATT